MSSRRGFGQPGPEVPVFVISVAAELTGLHPQTLRTYDRLGLVSPGRTTGGGRRYSLHDIEVLREVAELTASGTGLEGVRRILELESQVRVLREHVAGLEAQLDVAQHALRRGLAAPTARPTRNLPAVVAPGAGQSVTVWRRRR